MNQPSRKREVGAWRSLVAHLLGVQGVVGSNPAAPTILNPIKTLKSSETIVINNKENQQDELSRFSFLLTVSQNFSQLWYGFGTSLVRRDQVDPKRVAKFCWLTFVRSVERGV
jgi:hypothetical protein